MLKNYLLVTFRNLLEDRVFLNEADLLNKIFFLSGLIAYSYLPKKPSHNLEIIDESMALSF
jgi:hypothetical protein